jgi:NIMA-interacting peptidyl-prolyl cis-trans isomerase 4
MLFKQGKNSNGLKAATAVNVRHILCEKHSKAMEALGKIQVLLPLAADIIL